MRPPLNERHLRSCRIPGDAVPKVVVQRGRPDDPFWSNPHANENVLLRFYAHSVEW